MILFRRAINFVLWIVAFLVGLVVGLGLFFARQVIRPPRKELWATPKDIGLAFEAVDFPARDGLRLSGWFVPAGTSPAPAIILIHGWPWNRLGDQANDWLAELSGNKPVDLLRLAHAIHQAGYGVLMFDLRNHGQSAAGGPVSFGMEERQDLLGALDYLSGRSEVIPNKIGVIGFSMGANTILYALPHTQAIQAAVAVQPTSAGLFAGRYASDLLGPLGRPVLLLADFIYRRKGGPGLSAAEPVLVAASAGKTPIFYIQGTGDRWGSVANVAHIASVTPVAAGPLFVDTAHRYDGYRYVIENPQVALQFLSQYL